MQEMAKEIESAVQHFLSDELRVAQPDGILVAVSGGKDSMALLTMLHQLGFPVQAAHVNFQLRATEADQDEELVSAYCKKLGVPVHVVRFDTLAMAKELGKSIQETARDLRYTWFEKIRAANKLHWIATAHHLQDSLETFLLNLSRGAGLKGLLGIPKKRGAIIRPLSNLRPAAIIKYIAAHAIPYREDASNSKTKYTRNKIRLELLPTFLELPGDPLKAFLENQSRLSQYYKFAQSELEKHKKAYVEELEDRTIVNIKAIQENEHADLLLFEILGKLGFTSSQIEDLREAKEGALFHSPQHEACLRNNFLTIQEKTIASKKSFLIKSLAAGELQLAEGKLSWRKELAPIDFSKQKNTLTAYLNIDKLKFPLTLRRWEKGDRFRPLGMHGKSKLLSDYFADKKFSAFEKNEAWLLCSAGEICWLVGQRQAEPFKLEPDSQHYLLINWKPKSL